MPTANGPEEDPVRRRRKVIAVWTRRANKGGYLFYLLAIGLFIVAFTTDFTDTFSTLITACLIIGSLLLAPAIVLGYAIKATEKEDPGPNKPGH